MFFFLVIFSKSPKKQPPKKVKDVIPSIESLEINKQNDSEQKCPSESESEDDDYIENTDNTNNSNNTNNSKQSIPSINRIIQN